LDKVYDRINEREAWIPWGNPHVAKPENLSIFGHYYDLLKMYLCVPSQRYILKGQK
jgi:hypothetical protein